LFDAPQARRKSIGTPFVPTHTVGHGKRRGHRQGEAKRSSPPAGLTALAAPETFASTEVHIIGTKYVDYFADGSTTIAVPGDPKISANLDKPNTPIPTHAGMTWVHTIGQNLYDTPSGDLEVGDYAVQADGSYIQHAPPFVSSTSTPVQVPTSTVDNDNAAGGTSASATSAEPPSAPDTSATTFSIICQLFRYYDKHRIGDLSRAINSGWKCLLPLECP
jgi:hypothetical protein